MQRWARRIRGAIGMGLTWAVGWAIGGLLIGVSSLLFPALPWDAFFSVFDAPLPALAMPGFVGGVLFSIVVSIAARHRRFDELTVRRFAAWGALGGLLLAILPVTLVVLGLGTAAGSMWQLWSLTAAIAAPLIGVSAASAAGSLMIARSSADRELRQLR